MNATPANADRPPTSVAPVNDRGAQGGDGELLRRYVAARDEAAFRELVRRHIDLVYSAALRRLAGDAHHAADVTQQVFTAFERQAAKLPADIVLPAWFYTTTRHLTANLIRSEHSRRARERAAHEMNELNTPALSTADWERVRPVLDEVMDELGDADRTAILLRFFARQPLAAIGSTLHVSEDAARMRIERALEKLRAALGRRGIASAAGALGGALAQYTVVAAPTGFASAVATGALAGTGGAITLMSLAKITIGLLTAATAAAAVSINWQQLPPKASAAPALQRQLVEGRAGKTQFNLQAAETPSSSYSQPAATATQPAAARSEVPKTLVSRGTDQRGSLAPATSPVLGSAAAAVDGRVRLLDSLVHLTSEQRTRVTALFRNEAAILDQFTTVQERAEKGIEARQASRAAVREILTPEQRKTYDLAPQRLGGGLRADPASLVMSLDRVVRLTANQKQKATEIFWDDITDQLAALPAGEELHGFFWHNPVRERLRAILTPEQQAIFDVTSPYKKTRGE